jgi:hypothetical protein
MVIDDRCRINFTKPVKGWQKYGRVGLKGCTGMNVETTGGHSNGYNSGPRTDPGGRGQTRALFEDLTPPNGEKGERRESRRQILVFLLKI